MIDLQLERRIAAAPEEVFARLSDIDGHNAWMPKKGSILRRTRQTSEGQPGLGTTFIDETNLGSTPGEIVEFDPPYKLTYHWWDSSKSGRVKTEGWPGYALEPAEPDGTRLRHHARMHTYGVYRLATPILRWIAIRERTATVDALEASFKPNTQTPP